MISDVINDVCTCQRLKEEEEKEGKTISALYFQLHTQKRNFLILFTVNRRSGLEQRQLTLSLLASHAGYCLEPERRSYKIMPVVFKSPVRISSALGIFKT